jgi:hypothetical protein
MAHRFNQLKFDNNLERAVLANAVLCVELATYLKDTGVIVVADLPPRAKTAYQILVPMVDQIGN